MEEFQGIFSGSQQTVSKFAELLKPETYWSQIKFILIYDCFGESQNERSSETRIDDTVTEKHQKGIGRVRVMRRVRSFVRLTFKFHCKTIWRGSYDSSGDFDRFLTL